MIVFISHLIVPIEWIPYLQKECVYYRMTSQNGSSYTNSILDLCSYKTKKKKKKEKRKKKRRTIGGRAGVLCFNLSGLQLHKQ